MWRKPRAHGKHGHRRTYNFRQTWAQGRHGTGQHRAWGGHKEDLGHWEDLEHQEDLGYKENRGKLKLQG